MCVTELVKICLCCGDASHLTSAHNRSIACHLTSADNSSIACHLIVIYIFIANYLTSVNLHLYCKSFHW